MSPSPPDHATLAIDYGSRLAGTTVIVRPGPDGSLEFLASAKKQDADAMIVAELTRRPAATVYLDAPLSLPGVYRGLPGFNDYHYRRADRELNAMSPMFLGGLTARAMRLAATPALASHCTFHETYPAAQAKRLQLPPDQYKKSLDHLPPLAAQLASHITTPFNPTHLTTWHHFDAVLAWLTAERHARSQIETYGDAMEGSIYL